MVSSLVQKERIYKFDNLKFLLILLVVIGHFVDLYVNDFKIMKSIFIFIYSFHMPLFIFITGLFQKKIKSWKDIKFKKIAVYIFIVYFLKVSIFFASKHFNLDCSFELFGGDGVYWYLAVIILYTFLIPIINKINFYYLFTFSLVLSLFAGYDTNIGDFLYLSRIIVFFPFYLIGYHLGNYKMKLVSFGEKKYVKVISSIVLFLFIYVCFEKLEWIYKFRPLFTGRNPYFILSEFDCTYKHRLFTYFISFIIGFCVLNIIPNKKIKIISNMGKRTLQVYALHQIFIVCLKGIGLFDYLKKVFGNYFVLVYLLIAVILTFLLSLKYIEKIFKYLSKKMINESL